MEASEENSPTNPNLNTMEISMEASEENSPTNPNLNIMEIPMEASEENFATNPNPYIMETRPEARSRSIVEVEQKWMNKRLEARSRDIVEVQQKWKRLQIEEERDENQATRVHQLRPCQQIRPPPTPITSAEDLRIAKLKRILKVLKGIDSSLLNSPIPLLPTLDEQRIYKLISCHLSYCIFLFNRESCSRILQQKQESPSPEDIATIPFSHIDDDSKNQENLKDLKAAEIYFPLQLDELIELLKECRHLITGPLDEESTFLNPHCELHKSQLLDILFDLEEMASSREYAPPSHGREIECYKEIQNSVAFFSRRTQAFVEFAMGIYPSSSPIWRNLLNDSFLDDTICDPPGHKFAVAFDLVPEIQSRLERYKRQLSYVFSNDGGRESYDCDDEVDSGGLDDRIDLDRAKQRSGAIMKSRIDCLRIIVSKFERIGELSCDPVPTIEEVRLYAQIAAHVHPAIWLSKTVKEVERNIGSGFHEVNVGGLEDLSCSSTGDNMSTRKRYLLEIVSYLRLIRSSCAIAIPTSEELDCYAILSKGLNLFSCSFPLEHGARGIGKSCYRFNSPEQGVAGTDKMKPPLVISDRRLLVLRHQLDLICRSKLKFFFKLNELSASIIYMVRGFVMSNNEQTENPSFEVAFSWLVKNGDQLGGRLMELFRNLPEGRIDRAIVILEEIASSFCYIYLMLCSATDSTEASLYSKQYEIVEAEVHNALIIMDKIKNLIV